MTANDVLAPLFEPFVLNGTVLKNRLVQSAMYSWFATSEGAVSERHLAYIVERARGGAGLITIENTCVDWATGRGSGIPVRIDEDRFIPGINDLVNAVHLAGSKLAVQLYHAGRQSDHRARLVRAGIRTELEPPLSASNVTSTAIGDEPRPMTIDEIDWMVERFAAAALRAVNAGVDVVEVHAVHGYLLTQFFSPQTNKRTDEYGGSIENRARFVRRVVRRVREIVGPDYPLLCRFSADERVPGAASVEDNLQLARWLAEDGIDAFNVSAGTYESRQWIYPPAGVEPGVLVPLARAVREATGKPVMGISRLGMDLTKAAGFVADGSIDLVGMGRSQLADPQTVNKARQGKWREIRPCIACAECAREFIAKQKRMQCVVNPELGNEFRRLMVPSARPRRIVVVGGGPAGMEAARAAATRGHSVVLLEASTELGGQLRHSAVPSFHAKEMRALINYWQGALEDLGVDIRLGVAATPETVDSLEADQVLVGTGARWAAPAGLPEDLSDAPTAHDMILDSSTLGSTVLIVGGNEVGLNAALVLGERGHQVTLLERTGSIGLEISDLMRNQMLSRADDLGVEMITGVNLTRAQRDQQGWDIELSDDAGAATSLTVQSVVVASQPQPADITGWNDTESVTVIGAAGQPTGRLYRATQDGFWATVES